MSKPVPKPEPVIVTPSVTTPQTQPQILISKESFTTKRVMGIVLVLALIGIGVAWIALSISGLPGWINIVFIVVALLIILVAGWLFFSS